MGVGMSEWGFKVIGMELEISVLRASTMIGVGAVGEEVEMGEEGGVAHCCFPKASVSEIPYQQSSPLTPS